MEEIDRIRQDFPPLQRSIDGKKVAYLDNACMTLKPRQVLEAMNYYYENLGACGGKRSSHDFSRETQERAGEAREKVADFIGAERSEVVWTRNTTEGVNLVANALGLEGGNVVASNLDHHSGILPFWKLQEEGGTELRIVEADRNGFFDVEDWKEEIGPDTGLVSLVHVSNATGTEAPVKEIVEIAHDNGARVLLDGAQSVPHQPVDVEDLGVDFLAFSVHKMLGPTGMGVLYGKEKLLEEMDRFMVGGDTVRDVGYSEGGLEPEFLSPPKKFEAGLQNYAGIIGAGAAVDYLEEIGMDEIEERERDLVEALTEEMKDVDGIEFLGPEDASKRKSLLAFTLESDSVAEKDLAEYLNEEHGVFLRAGHHCVAPFHHYSGVDPKQGEGSVRASLYFYNTEDEILKLKQGVEGFLEMTGQ